MISHDFPTALLKAANFSANIETSHERYSILEVSVGHRRASSLPRRGMHLHNLEPLGYSPLCLVFPWIYVMLTTLSSSQQTEATAVRSPDSLSLEAMQPKSGLHNFTISVTDTMNVTSLVNGRSFQIKIVDCDAEDNVCGPGGQCIAGEDPFDGDYRCICANGFVLNESTGLCIVDRSTTDLRKNEIRIGQSVFTCGANTVPNDSQDRCVVDADITECMATTDVKGTGIVVNCSDTSDAIPPDLGQVLSTVVTLDLSGRSPRAVQTWAAEMRRDNRTASQLRSLAIGPQTMTDLWQVLSALGTNTGDVSVDLRSAPSGLRLPSVLSRPVRQLTLDVKAIPWPLSAGERRRHRRATVIQPPGNCVAVRLNQTTSGMMTLCSGSQCVSCGLGQYATFNSESGEAVCRDCAAGGFFQDSQAWVGSGAHCACRLCGDGTFSSQPGAESASQCQKCPVGTDPSQNAGYRACPCLPGFWRRDRFGPCESCAETPGVVCEADIRVLKVEQNFLSLGQTYSPQAVPLGQA